MQHTESSIKIYYTKDYSLFKNIEGNRSLNHPKIDRIIADIESGFDLLRYCPILVIEKNNLLEIIDGQHRFYVAKELQSKVWYILAEELTLYEIARLNTNTEKWNARDFVACYAQLGNENYKILNSFLLNHPIPVTTAVSLLSFGRVDTGGAKKDFEHGDFKVNYLEFATDFLNVISRFLYAKNQKKYTRPFMRAIEKIYKSKKIDIEELIEKVNKDDSSFKYLETEKQFLTELEIIFNKGKHARTIIY